MNIEAQLQALDEGSMLRERSVHAPCSIRERKVGMSASRKVCDAMPSRPMRMTCLTPRTPLWDVSHEVTARRQSAAVRSTDIRFMSYGIRVVQYKCTKSTLMHNLYTSRFADMAAEDTDK